jgi:hypothetical protein
MKHRRKAQGGVCLRSHARDASEIMHVAGQWRTGGHAHCVLLSTPGRSRLASAAEVSYVGVLC